jgi:isopentenyl-diphosphate delta-isomerase
MSEREAVAAVEQVVLLDPQRTPCGVADKATIHGANTPYHLAFSCYVFDADGRFLVTRRAHDKATWPGVWTNSCCGHPAPGEEPVAAVARRLWEELELTSHQIVLALPDFSYRASYLGIEEFEYCPVFLARVEAQPRPARAEVAEAEWWSWEAFVAAATAPDTRISPWAQAQVRQLESGGQVVEFLARP